MKEKLTLTLPTGFGLLLKPQEPKKPKKTTEEDVYIPPTDEPENDSEFDEDGEEDDDGEETVESNELSKLITNIKK